MEIVTADEWAEFSARYRTYCTEIRTTGGSQMLCVLVGEPMTMNAVISQVMYGVDGKAFRYEIDRDAVKGQPQ